MSSGECFKREKERKARKQRLINAGKRKEEGSKAKTKILIITEGEKTEPFYLEKLCHKLGLKCKISTDYNNTYLIKIVNIGEDPSQIIARVQKELIKNKTKKNWNKIFCVFDRDTHQHFSDAKDKIHTLNSTYQQYGQEIIPIISCICFELWFILHFHYTTKQYSCFADLLPDLKRCNSIFSNYEKKDCSFFEKILPKLKTAYKNAQQLRTARNNKETSNYTDVDILIQHLVREVSEKFWNDEENCKIFSSFRN